MTDSPNTEADALRRILAGGSSGPHRDGIAAVTDQVAHAFGGRCAWVAECLPDSTDLRVVGSYPVPVHADYDPAATPCLRALNSLGICRTAGDESLDLPEQLGAGDLGHYTALALRDSDDQTLGVLATVGDDPLPSDAASEDLFRVFALHATADLQRRRLTQQLKTSQDRWQRLFDGAIDGIVELDSRLQILHINDAASRLFNCEEDPTGLPFVRFLPLESRTRLTRIIRNMWDDSLWIPDGLLVMNCQRREFPAEATLARYAQGDVMHYMLILRSVDEHVTAQERIRSLADETQYLREEIRKTHDFGEIVGQSPAVQQMAAEIAQVAESDATVLIQGETGTGKELVARAVHAASPRHDGPLIRVNCAAVPANLIESEFFGHEKGAFTGATQRREGRFALADGGTLFLDEIGELPLELQAKLLRVLQEGEFEPVGSARSHRVDVRLVAATNRDLSREVEEGRFREDFYYRLHVFPVRVPPLRERGTDILLLTDFFAQKYARRWRRPLQPLSERDRGRLLGYDWPGNVRELQNVIERAAITARDGHLDLERALPTVGDATSTVSTTADVADILTVEELAQFEKANIQRALDACGWKVAGPSGAAARLNMKPSTLNSRMKTLEIQRPRPSE